MKINYFDLGLGPLISNHCWELKQMLNILPSLSYDYNIYGIEAGKESCLIADKLFKKFKNVHIYHKAISLKEEKIKLFHQKNHPKLINNRLVKSKSGHGGGSSIYNTKNNVLENEYELVDGIKFSTFLKEENIELDGDTINIVKINIEGAEWDFFKDIIENNLHKKIHIFCGQGHDVTKIKEFTDNGTDTKYFKMLEENNIKLHRFSEHKPEKNADIKQLIQNILTTYFSSLI